MLINRTVARSTQTIFKNGLEINEVSLKLLNPPVLYPKARQKGV